MTKLVSGNKSLSTDLQMKTLVQSRSISQNNNTAEPTKGVNIALVEPTFTEAAYNKAFYIFYAKM